MRIAPYFYITPSLRVLAVTISLFSITGCEKDPTVKNLTTIATGHHTLLTPMDGNTPRYRYLDFYSSASSSGLDQPIWVAVNLNSFGDDLLVSRIDTAGQALCSRVIHFNNAHSSSEVYLTTALTDGSCMVAGGEDNETVISQLETDGSTKWSKRIVLDRGLNQYDFASGLASVGTEALLCLTNYGIDSPNPNQHSFSHVSADGTISTSVGYAYPSPVGVAKNSPIQFKSLPGGNGAFLLEKLEDNIFLLSSIDATGHVRWVKQITLTGFFSTNTPDYFDMVVAPVSGDFVLLVAKKVEVQAQLIRLSPSGDLRGVIALSNTALIDNTYPRFGKLAVGPQEEAAWTVENSTQLYYYAVDAQGKPIANQVLDENPVGRGSNTLSTYGLVSIGYKGAYGLGGLAGPAPGNDSKTSINFLNINSIGRVGCILDKATTFNSSIVMGTQVIALPIPASVQINPIVTNNNLENGPITLINSNVCQ